MLLRSGAEDAGTPFVSISQLLACGGVPGSVEVDEALAAVGEAGEDQHGKAASFVVTSGEVVTLCADGLFLREVDARTGQRTENGGSVYVHVGANKRSPIWEHRLKIQPGDCISLIGAARPSKYRARANSANRSFGSMQKCR